MLLESVHGRRASGRTRMRTLLRLDEGASRFYSSRASFRLRLPAGAPRPLPRPQLCEDDDPVKADGYIRVVEIGRAPLPVTTYVQISPCPRDTSLGASARLDRFLGRARCWTLRRRRLRRYLRGAALRIYPVSFIDRVRLPPPPRGRHLRARRLNAARSRPTPPRDATLTSPRAAPSPPSPRPRTAPPSPPRRSRNSRQRARPRGAPRLFREGPAASPRQRRRPRVGQQISRGIVADRP